MIPLKRNIHHNYLMGNYNALFAVDTDDGSSYYEINHVRPCKLQHVVENHTSASCRVRP